MPSAAPALRSAAPALRSAATALRSAAGPYFGEFGGRFLPEALVPALDELTEVYEKAIIDPEFVAELRALAADYTGRPSLLSEAPRFSQLAGGWPQSRIGELLPGNWQPATADQAQ